MKTHGDLWSESQQLLLLPNASLNVLTEADSDGPSLTAESCCKCQRLQPNPTCFTNEHSVACGQLCQVTNRPMVRFERIITRRCVMGETAPVPHISFIQHLYNLFKKSSEEAKRLLTCCFRFFKTFSAFPQLFNLQ